MKQTQKEKRRSFKYHFSKTRSTIVEFDVEYVRGRKIATNITFNSNWRAHYPEKPEIAMGEKGQYGFQKGKVWMTNGDIQQMIIRIHRILDGF